VAARPALGTQMPSPARWASAERLHRTTSSDHAPSMQNGMSISATELSSFWTEPASVTSVVSYLRYRRG
jgi:hypothetical protein